MSTTEQREKLASLLRKVALEETSPEDALALVRKWADLPWSEGPFAAGYHWLEHFYIDADLRARNPAYARAQKAGLLSLAEQLHNS